MKYLFVMGTSGSGKSTLAKILTERDPEHFYRPLQITTRKPRDGEIDGVDYEFVNEYEFEKKLPNMFQFVVHQFAPGKYGSLKSNLDPNKWNVLVVSMEALLNAMSNMCPYDEGIILNILVGKNEEMAIRDNRWPIMEENFNKGVLSCMKGPTMGVNRVASNSISFGGVHLDYFEIDVANLRDRTCDENFIDYFKVFFMNNYE